MPGRMPSSCLAGRLLVGASPRRCHDALALQRPRRPTSMVRDAPAAFGHVPPQPTQARYQGLTVGASPAIILRRALWTAADPSPASPSAAPRRSFFRRTASFLFSALFFTALGAAIAASPIILKALPMRSVSDAQTLTMVKPADLDAQAKEDYINAHPLVASLRADPLLVESRPHLKIPPPWRLQNLMGGTLLGPGRIAIPPLTWSARDGKRLVQIVHVGPDMCGHVGIVHGGFLATMLDEGLGRCCFPVLPHNMGMTASLQVNYKAPARADQFLVLRATTTKVEGRKAWVEGRIETLPSAVGEEPAVLATGSALFISPKKATGVPNLYT